MDDKSEFHMECDVKKVYIDRTANTECMSVFINGAEVINAGTTVYSMPQSVNNEEYQRFADDYDIHFIFDDAVPEIDFYAVPQIDIFAIDSYGGYIGTVGNSFDVLSEYAVVYIDKDKNCFLIAWSAKELVANAAIWKENKKPYNDIQVFNNIKEAQKVLEFVNVPNLNIQISI